MSFLSSCEPCSHDFKQNDGSLFNDNASSYQEENLVEDISGSIDGLEIDNLPKMFTLCLIGNNQLIIT